MRSKIWRECWHLLFNYIRKEKAENVKYLRKPPPCVFTPLTIFSKWKSLYITRGEKNVEIGSGRENKKAPLKGLAKEV